MTTKTTEATYYVTYRTDEFGYETTIIVWAESIADVRAHFASREDIFEVISVQFEEEWMNDSKPHAVYVLKSETGELLDMHRLVRTGRLYGGVETKEDYETGDNGYKFLRTVTYTKGDRIAIVELMHGNMPWGRSNAYMTPVQPSGRTRSYKNRENARAQAYEFVTGK